MMKIEIFRNVPIHFRLQNLINQTKKNEKVICYTFLCIKSTIVTMERIEPICMYVLLMRFRWYRNIYILSFFFFILFVNFDSIVWTKLTLVCTNKYLHVFFIFTRKKNIYWKGLPVSHSHSSALQAKRWSLYKVWKGWTRDERWTPSRIALKWFVIFFFLLSFTVYFVLFFPVSFLFFIYILYFASFWSFSEWANEIQSLR